MHWNASAIPSRSDEIRAFYAQSGYVLLKQFATREFPFEGMRSLLEALPARRVQCWEPGVLWSERCIPCDGEIAAVFQRPALVEFLGRLLSRSRARLERSMLWASVYRQGEYIHRHVDNEGEFQIIFCHEATDTQNGGALFLKPHDATVRLQLERHDAVLFRATEVEHWTSPVTPTAEVPSPRRTTVACRYWFC